VEDDGRRTVWKPIFDKEPIASIGALALAPSNPKIIYVGTGVNTIYADSNYGDGIYKSVDGERTGSMWDWGTRGTSGESWSIRGIRTSCWLRRWVTVQGRTKSEEFFARRTEGGAGRKFCTKTMSRRRLIFVSNQGIREWCTRRCGTGFENRDKKVHLTVPGAGSSNQPMKA